MAIKLLTKLFMVFVLIFVSCNGKDEQFELEILSNKLHTFSKEDYGVKDTLNVIRYKLTNKSKNNYFLYLNKHEVTPSINFDNNTKSLHVYDQLTSKEVKYSQNSINDFSDACGNCRISYDNKIYNNPLIKDLNKNYLFPNKNNQIFIYAGETIYLESLIKIQAYLPILNDINVDVAHIEQDIPYHAKMILHVFQKSENSFDWQTRMRIKDNNFKIYSKKIESKNYVPIKIIE